MTVLMAIGGAMDFEDPVIFKEFARRAGGPEARIVILPQASGEPDTGAYYIEKFQSVGVQLPPTVLEFRERSRADDPGHLAALQDATGIFISGGTQMRIPPLVGGTRFEAALMEAYQRGAVVGGTSAGAAVLSRVMLAYGRGGPTPRERIAQFTPGLGFTDKTIFDQHFRQRDRLGRLAYAVAAHPGRFGVGVDENTAAIIEDDARITVCGKNAITIVDGSALAGTNIAEVTASRPVAISGLTLHMLTAGCTFDLNSRTAFIPQNLLPA